MVTGATDTPTRSNSGRLATTATGTKSHCGPRTAETQVTSRASTCAISWLTMASNPRAGFERHPRRDHDGGSPTGHGGGEGVAHRRSRHPEPGSAPPGQAMAAAQFGEALLGRRLVEPPKRRRRRLSRQGTTTASTSAPASRTSAAPTRNHPRVLAWSAMHALNSLTAGDGPSGPYIASHRSDLAAYGTTSDAGPVKNRFPTATPTLTRETAISP